MIGELAPGLTSMYGQKRMPPGGGGAFVGVGPGAVGVRVAVAPGGLVGVGPPPPLQLLLTWAPPLYAVPEFHAGQQPVPLHAPLLIHSSPVLGTLFVQGSLPCVQYAA